MVSFCKTVPLFHSDAFGEDFIQSSLEDPRLLLFPFLSRKLQLKTCCVTFTFRVFSNVCFKDKSCQPLVSEGFLCSNQPWIIFIHPTQKITSKLDGFSTFDVYQSYEVALSMAAIVIIGILLFLPSPTPVHRDGDQPGNGNWDGEKKTCQSLIGLENGQWFFAFFFGSLEIESNSLV